MSLYKTLLERHLFELQPKQKKLKKGYLIAIVVGTSLVAGWISRAVTSAISKARDRKRVERGSSTESVRRPLDSAL